MQVRVHFTHASKFGSVGLDFDACVFAGIYYGPLQCIPNYVIQPRSILDQDLYFRSWLLSTQPNGQDTVAMQLDHF